MTANPHLSFNGECKAAFTFYAQVLGGEIEMMMTYGESPAASLVPAEARDTILHTTLIAGDLVLTGADPPPGRYQAPQGISILLQEEYPAQAERIFTALAEGGSVIMPLEETFWAARFGMVTDRFGIPWMINCGKES